MDALIRFWSCLTDAGTAVPAIVGMAVGFSIGFFLSRPFWDFISEGRRFAREDRLRREQEEEKRKTQERAAKARQGLQYNAAGVLEDCNGNIYCPACMKRGVRSVMRHTHSRYTRFRCPECGRAR